MVETKIHPFEKAGLGKAPFRYVGVVAQEISHGQRVIGSVGGCAVTTKAGGTCAYCHKYILNMFNVESSDGKIFHVGCDCICKVDAKLAPLVEKDAKKLKADREQARITAAKAALPEAHVLKSQPHPNPYHASNGKTLWHYVEWLFANGGKSGQLRAARMVELAIAPRVEEGGSR